MPTQEITIQERVHALHETLAAGRITDALAEFYADDVVMQENTEDPCVGLDANLERELAWLDTIAEWKGFEVLGIAVHGDVSYAETALDYRTKDGHDVHMEQVARAVWQDGKIVDERFYHA